MNWSLVSKDNILPRGNSLSGVNRLYVTLYRKITISFARLLLGVEDTGHVTIELRPMSLLFLLFSSFFFPFVLYCFTSTVSSTPSRSPSLSVESHKSSGSEEMTKGRFLYFLSKSTIASQVSHHPV